MSPHRTTTSPAPPPNPTVIWRRDRLVDAGFEPLEAGDLAEDCGVDLHAILDLVDHGCPPALAARILAPFDDERWPC